MTVRTASRARTMTMTVAAALAALATVVAACGTPAVSTGSAPAASTSTLPNGARTASEAKLYTAMHELWSQHMEWTYAAIAAFAAGTQGLTPTLNRLLQNQTDIGDAVKPYYGAAAGTELSELLHAHINDYVPVLTAAKAGDQAKLKDAVAAVMANGVEIGKFLEGANPNWAGPEMEQMMNTHNTQTLQYATDQLQGRYADSITVYGEAEAHMSDMADMLSAGIIKQFPDKFTS